MNKKLFFCFVAALASILCLTPAFAETIDIDSMTVAELIQLEQRISSRIVELLAFNGNEIYPDTYTVGIDMRPGRYLFTANTDHFNICVFKNAEEYESYEYLKREGVLKGETCHLLLEDGMILDVISGSALVQIIETPIWAP